MSNTLGAFLLKSKILNKTLTEDIQESPRMKQFHEKLKLQPIPKVGPRERFVDLVLVETDPRTGELITNSEKDPTKWGDWQHGGRVSDF
ncbi:hypothetical protein ALC56_08257 [Trachymyrmex septentrionalis]|uniref:Uncharacterized protein n=1 Tax=Trachymyrmex septentrionalis TaxID=34720 RepID=A0A151JV73_9HYME|nr:PREDICTED: succinate dehydrogenase assembly factor 4, mitochondrial-like isoform X2 [Trachymyrmex septentrionalis]KYN37354.1 hypothetical protein ALC56_08257 [Trachymyrmex septentrionalis]